MSTSILVTHYYLVRNGIRKETSSSYYTDNFTQKSCCEKSKEWKSLGLAFKNKATKETIYVFSNKVVSSEEELITLLTEKLSDKRVELTKKQNAYIEECKSILANPSNKDSLNLLGINKIIKEASVGGNPDGSFTVTQFWTKLPTIIVSASGEILKVEDNYQGIAW